MRFLFSEEVQAPACFPSGLRIEDCRFGYEFKGVDAVYVMCKSMDALYKGHDFVPFFPSLQITEELMLRLWSNRYFQNDGWLVCSFGLRSVKDDPAGGVNSSPTDGVESSPADGVNSNLADGITRAASFVRLFNPETGETKELGTAYHLNKLRLEILRDVKNELSV